MLQRISAVLVLLLVVIFTTWMISCNEGENQDPPQVRTLEINEVSSEEAQVKTIQISLSAESVRCEGCHLKNGRGGVMQWRASSHYEASVGCFECHKANAEDTDAYEHYGEIISTIVSPLDCKPCHEAEVNQFLNSHHAEGGQILDSLDNVLAERVEGAKTFNGESPVVTVGCGYCHGTNVRVLEDGHLDPATYPNSGIGRINPDGSWGSCAACHTRHVFSLSQARRPENCGRCHLGPDHPQKEVYEESQHGILFHAFEDQLNLESDTWVAGHEVYMAPTCATCHMGATESVGASHNVGNRLSWVLRSPISNKTDNWEAKREEMQTVCLSCHAKELVNNLYAQLDAGVDLYNEKFAKPATEIYEALRNSGIVDTAETFDEEMEWLYWYLWHHEGRRARTGLAMIGPDYVQWHGFYDIAERFYIELIPEAIHLCEEAIANQPDKAQQAQAILATIDEILKSDMHKWFMGSEVR